MNIAFQPRHLVVFDQLRSGRLGLVLISILARSSLQILIVLLSLFFLKAICHCI
jgi:hypothetical protein